MSISFRCPSCGNTIQVADEHAGQPVQCPLCRQAFAAPRQGESVATPLSADATRPWDPSNQSVPAEGSRRGLAIAAMFLGILGICVPGIGLLGVILGIIALVQTMRRPQVYGGMGMAVAGIVVGAVAMMLQVVAVGILLPSLARAREMAKRTVCAANLGGMGKGMYTYAADGNQGWPVPAHWPASNVDAGSVNYVGRMGSKRGQSTSPMAGESHVVDGPDGRELSTTRSLWTLLRVGHSVPAVFICPSGTDTQNTELSPADYWDFGIGDVATAGPTTPVLSAAAWSQNSYGAQVPYGKYQPSLEIDSGVILIADKGPFGAVAETGAPPPPLTAADQELSSSNMRAYNSPNHGGMGNGEGQNAMYADSHVEYVTTPFEGVGNDNIYTQWSGPRGPKETKQTMGVAPSSAAPNLTPMAVTDSLIYP